MKKDGFNVLNKGRVVPFPASGHQHDFDRLFREIIHGEKPEVSGREQAAVKPIDMSGVSVPVGSEELFRVISRFEYALKEIGFVEGGRRDEAKVSWDRFTEECLGEAFLDRIVRENLAPVLLRNPPSRQIAKGGRLDWAACDPPKTTKELFRAVRRTRNNLFHGGKHGDHDADRNQALIAESICLLRQALEACADVQAAFENRW